MEKRDSPPSEFSRRDDEPTLNDLLDRVVASDPSVSATYEEINTRLPESEEPYGEPIPVEVPKEEMATFLRNTTVFRSMTEEELGEFVSRMSAVRYQSGALICREGDPGNEMWIICEGGMRVSKKGQTVAELPAGVPVGEMSILDGKPRSTDLYAVDNPLLFVLTRDAYAEVFRVNVDAGSRFVLNIAEIQQERLRATTRQAIDNAVAAERAQAEIRFVKNIQQIALSKHRQPLFGKSDIYVLYKGAREVSGDYYDFIEFPSHPNQLIVILGDAMGHGLRAGVEMLLAKCASYVQMRCEPSVEKVTEAINDITCYLFDAQMFMTFVVAQIDRETHTIRYINAGQQSHPYLYRMKRGELVALEPQTPQLGVIPNTTYHAEELTYEDNDLLLFYSDAITEAPYCPEGATTVDRTQLFGDERLREYIVQNAHKTAREFTEGLHAEVRAFCRFYDSVAVIGDEEFEGDDATMITIRLG